MKKWNENKTTDFYDQRIEISNYKYIILASFYKYAICLQ